MHDLPSIDIDKAMGALCRRSFYDFVQEFWTLIVPEIPIWNWHIKYLCDEAQAIVERLARREINPEDVIINIPPGSTKSLIWSVFLHPWAWSVDPTLRFLTISYSEALALQAAVKSRDVIRSDKYRRYFPYVQIKRDKDTKSDYENTLHGQRRSAGLTGTITGIHAHIIILDDPINPNQAASAAECLAANFSIDNVLSTRKVDKEVTVTVTIMQRLSDNDPTQHLLDKKGKRIKHICLPAEAIDGVKPEELARKYVNGLLDPIRLNRKVLSDAMIDLAPAGYAAQFSQRPVPAGGLIWQKWFKEVPDNLMPDVDDYVSYGTDWDLAYTEKDDNSASAYITAGKIGNKIFIDDLGFEWLEFPELIRFMKQRPGPHYIEAKASGKSARQVLVKAGIAAVEVKVIGGDKIARAKNATPTAAAGLVYVRQSLIEKLYSDPRQGILNFPKGKFADVADVLAQCLQRLARKSKIRSTRAGATEDDMY